MDLHNNPNMGTDLLEVKVKQIQDKIKELTQELGNVQNSVEAMASDIQTNTLTASVSVTTENLSASGDVSLGNVTAENLATEGLEISNIDVDSVTSSESELGNASAEYMNVERDTSTDRMQVKSLLRGTPIASTQYVGYDEEGTLIRVDPTIGIAKWETAPSRANEIRPVDNASVRVERSLTLDEALENVEEMDTENLLGLDASGKVVSKDTTTFLQKKLTPGYNIDIDEETNTISCDITTMQMKGSVETVEDLPTTGNVRGDVYNVTTTNQNYCWDGTTWFIIGSSVDMSDYYTKAETNSAIADNVGKIIVVTNENADNLISEQEDKVVWYRGTMSNTPFNSSSQIMLNSKTYTAGSSKNVYQEVERYGTSANKYAPAKYIRYGYRSVGSTDNYTWSDWERIVTESELVTFSIKNFTRPNEMWGYYTICGNRCFCHIKFILATRINDWGGIASDYSVPSAKTPFVQPANGKTGASNSIYINNEGFISQGGGGGMDSGTYEFDFDYEIA